MPGDDLPSVDRIALREVDHLQFSVGTRTHRRDRIAGQYHPEPHLLRTRAQHMARIFDRSGTEDAVTIGKCPTNMAEAIGAGAAHKDHGNGTHRNSLGQKPWRL